MNRSAPTSRAAASPGSRAERPPARRAAPAGRQVDQPPGADPRRAGCRREPDRRSRRRRRRSLDRRDHAPRSGRRSSASVDAATAGDGRTVELPDRLARRRRPPPAGRGPGLRQLGDEPPAAERRPCRIADDRHARRRRFVASAPGRSYHRTAALDGRRAPGAPERLPPSPDRGWSYPAPGDRLHDARAECAGEVGSPPGGASGGGPNDGPRVDRDPRPHGADAPRTRRAGRAGRHAGWRGGLDGTRRAWR